MKKILTSIAAGSLLAALALGVSSNLLADGPTFTTIDFPGSIGTLVQGTNNRGDIVGLYTSADKATHGFLFSRGQFISIDFPGAAFTEVWGIGPRGDILGDYSDTLSGSGLHHGFVLSTDGVFTTIDFPGAVSSYAVGMNSHGDILGSHNFSDNVNHNFVMSGSQFPNSGHFTQLEDVPGAGTTVAIAILGSDVVGGYVAADKTGHGFLLSDGQFITIDYPAAGVTNTVVNTIDSRGEMAGRYVTNGVNHGFLLSGGQFHGFDYPGATYTAVEAIAANGDLLGRYRDSNNVVHGFRLTDLGLACVSSGS
jgi:hypothetical protein